MKLGEIYRIKDSCANPYIPTLILISQFASRWHENGCRESVIVTESFMDDQMLYCSSLHVTFFKDVNEILNYYNLFMTQEQYSNYLKEKGY